MKAACWVSYGLINTLLVLLFIESFYPLTDLFFVLTSIMLLSSSWLVFKWIKGKQYTAYYQLDEQGHWQWTNALGDTECWQISATSRVAVYGCYLVLSRQVNDNLSSLDIINQQHRNQKEHALASTQLFIFKDSLTINDYARLCRVIQHLNSQ